MAERAAPRARRRSPRRRGARVFLAYGALLARSRADDAALYVSAVQASAAAARVAEGAPKRDELVAQAAQRLQIVRVVVDAEVRERVDGDVGTEVERALSLEYAPAP